MNKFLLIILAITLIFAEVAFAVTKNKQGDIMSDKKILVAYFSWSGNTQFIAERINKQVGGGKYTIAEDMGKLAVGSEVLKPLVVYERGYDNIDQEIETWLKEIK